MKRRQFLTTSVSAGTAAVSATDSTTQKVRDSYRSFRKVIIPWSRVGLPGCMNARSLRFKYG